MEQRKPHFPLWIEPPGSDPPQLSRLRAAAIFSIDVENYFHGWRRQTRDRARRTQPRDGSRQDAGKRITNELRAALSEAGDCRQPAVMSCELEVLERF